VKVFVDENIPRMTVQMLRDMGHDVWDIRGPVDEGMPDQDVWRRVKETGCLLITPDRGFSRRRSETHQGILVITLKQPNRQKIHARVVSALGRFPDETSWRGLLVIVRDRVQSVWRNEIADG